MRQYHGVFSCRLETQLWRCCANTCLCLAGFPRDSLFHGREVSTHINATWGGHVLVDAAKALLKVRGGPSLPQRALTGSA